MNLLNELYIAWLCRLNAIKTDEKGGSEMIAVVIMIGIVVILAVVFREQLGNMVKNIFEQTSTRVNNIMKDIET